MQIYWGVNLHDDDGDVFEDCVLIYVDDHTILKFKDVDQLQAFVESIDHFIPAIRKKIADKK